MLPNISSLAAPKVVMATTLGATDDNSEAALAPYRQVSARRYTFSALAKEICLPCTNLSIFIQYIERVKNRIKKCLFHLSSISKTTRLLPFEDALYLKAKHFLFHLYWQYIINVAYYRLREQNHAKWQISAHFFSNRLKRASRNHYVISYRGLKFRAEYRRVAELVSVITCPTLCLSATLTKVIAEDLTNLLALGQETFTLACTPDRYVSTWIIRNNPIDRICGYYMDCRFGVWTVFYELSC